MFFRPNYTTRVKPEFIPAPMPQVRVALLSVRDLQEAADRAAKAWNLTQLRDALRSVRYFLELAESSLEKEAAALLHRAGDNDKGNGPRQAPLAEGPR